MAQPFAVGWHVNEDAADEEAAAILLRDPVWNCFALADLEPPLRTYSQFPLARHSESNERAICLVLRHPIIGEVISPFGNEEGIVAILKQVSLPTHPLIQAQESHLSLLQRYYHTETQWRSMLRMAIPSSSQQALLQTYRPSQSIKQLSMVDLPALESFYAQHSENPFPPDLFAQALFFGVYEGNRIIAAGGTHVLSRTYQLAVLGYILTAPQARRQGLATAITTTLVTKLSELGFSTIVLNVFEDNSPAIRIYQHLGFQTHHRLFTGKAVLDL